MFFLYFEVSGLPVEGMLYGCQTSKQHSVNTKTIYESNKAVLKSCVQRKHHLCNGDRNTKLLRKPEYACQMHY